MKNLLLPILLVGSAALVGMYYLVSIIINNSYETLALRFSQSFFNIFTLIPLSIIGLGWIILVWSISFRKFSKEIRQQSTLFSILVMIFGFSTFGFYLLD